LVTPNVVTAEEIAKQPVEKNKEDEKEPMKVEETKPVSVATTTVEEEKPEKPVLQTESNKKESKVEEKEKSQPIEEKQSREHKVEAEPVKEHSKEEVKQSDPMQVDEVKQPEEQKDEEKKRKREEEKTTEPTEKERDDKKAKKDETPAPSTTSVAEPVKATRTVLSSGPPVQPFLSALTNAARSTARQQRQQEPRVVPPSSRAHTNTLLITGFVRPLNTKKVTNMLEGKGRKVLDFWMNDIKTHCYVTFESEEQGWI